jgi:hypothetical protein
MKKDKLIPMNPAKVPVMDKEKPKRYPSGYRYLAYCLGITVGVKIILDMLGNRKEGQNVNGKSMLSCAGSQKHVCMMKM